MNPNTAITMAALGMTPRAAPAGNVERVPAPSQTAYAADQLAAEIGSRLSRGVDGPAPKGDQSSAADQDLWAAVAAAVVAEAGASNIGGQS